eukprot:TRINITY_DN12756_c0_g1_i1.p1 TRINITY_DN12756_c0_g1~~TRINITY_DN12756_c0_g1_i1.p1  ORF type:complete len:202 (+),score=58.40 TRINITY_DN12756_c0_g1_i1:88-693(+)
MGDIWAAVRARENFSEDLVLVGQVLHGAVSTADRARRVYSAEFDRTTAHPLPIEQYLLRLFKYMNCSARTFLHALLILGSIKVQLNSYNAHNFLLAACTVCMKLQEDRIVSNMGMAKIGGVPLAALNRLERSFLGVAWSRSNLWVGAAGYKELVAALHATAGSSPAGPSCAARSSRSCASTASGRGPPAGGARRPAALRSK